MNLQLNKYYYFIFVTFLNVSFTNDKLYKVKRFFISCGLILEPTVAINNGQLFENDNSSVLGGFKIGIDYISSRFNKKRIGFVSKYKVFFSKLKDMDLYKRSKLKDDFISFIFGLQAEIGLSIILNRNILNIEFDEKNRINRHINSISFLVGLKEEIGKMNNFLKAKKKFPTKLIGEIMYILDIKQGFSFYLSASIFQCFSLVYLFSFNKNDICRIFNNKNYFNWNITIELGLLGINLFI